MNKPCILSQQERTILTHFYKYKYYFLLLPSAVATFLLLVMNIGFDINFRTHSIFFSWSGINDYTFIDVNEKDFFIKTEGCNIPGFKAFDQSVIQYVHGENPILCHNNTNPPLTDSDHTSLWVVEEAFANYKVRDASQFSCCYTPFYRQSSKLDVNDDRYQYKDNCVTFYNRTEIEDEFIRVECKYDSKIIYQDFYSFVIKKISNKIDSDDPKRNKYNVLVIGIDAVSRLNFHRTMPKTVKHLQDSDSIEFKGYNKVGDNTYPNLIPVLTGLSDKELSETCYTEKNSTFDDCDFIWKKFSKAGYYTALAEDAAPIGVFNYFKDGFLNTPTDYYWRTFNYLADREIGHEKHLNSNLCLGPRLSVDVLLSYIKKYVKAMEGSPHFGFFWETSISHDFLNYPMLCDEQYVTLLKSLESEGLLDNTVLILMSDHGIRWGGIRTTHQGHVEERLPFLFITLPASFKVKYPFATLNLRKNTRRLTTPFDLYETMLNILNMDAISNKKLYKIHDINEYPKLRGLSLFLPINENRTCQSAGIEPHWCTCYQTRKLPTDDAASHKVANIVVDYINNLLANYIHCAKLKLSKIIDITVGEPFYANKLKDVNHIVLDYTITLETQPGEGEFEATVRNTLSGLNVTGAVSRINLYGKQSSCIDDFHLKLYCYCDNYVPQ